jgi:hypothetical protein
MQILFYEFTFKFDNIVINVKNQLKEEKEKYESFSYI